MDRRAWWAIVHGVTKSQTQWSTSIKHNMTYYIYYIYIYIYIIYDSVSEEGRDPTGASRRVVQGGVPEMATFEDV